MKFYLILGINSRFVFICGIQYKRTESTGNDFRYSGIFKYFTDISVLFMNGIKLK